EKYPKLVRNKNLVILISLFLFEQFVKWRLGERRRRLNHHPKIPNTITANRISVIAIVDLSKLLDLLCPGFHSGPCGYRLAKNAPQRHRMPSLILDVLSFPN
ncbi:MAG: hypothetical protein AAF283_09285, partial [Cyanobacteria bacterium P01_A01_bin.70]